MKLKIFLFPLLIFILMNLFVIFNYGYYHDDWGFFNFNDESFFEHSNNIWKTEGIELRRYPNVIFYLLASALPNKELLYFSLAIFGFLLCYQIYDILNFILKNKKLSTDINQFGLMSLICVWYFLPFNIGGQIWSADLHVKVSMFFFLAHYQFLIRKKLFKSIVFLLIAFSSYEMFYLIYLPLSLLIYFFGLVDKSFFKKYLIYSSIIQIYFLFDRKRPEYEFELFVFIERNILNIFRFFYSIHSSLASFSNIYAQIIMLSPIIYFIYCIKKKKLFLNILLILILTLGLNSLILSGGHYGFTGQGVFSRSFYYASFCIFLFTFFIFIFNEKKNKFLIIAYLFLFGLSSFYFESKSWIKSWEIQKQVFSNKKINHIQQNYGQNNLVIFFGPCKYNGVEVFHAPWDIGRSIKETNPKNENWFTVLTDWDLQINEEKGDIGLHNFHYTYHINDFDNLILWDYFKDTLHFVKPTSQIKKSDIDTFNKFNNYRSCEIQSNKYKKNLIDPEKVLNYLKNFKIT